MSSISATVLFGLTILCIGDQANTAKRRYLERVLKTLKFLANDLMPNERGFFNHSSHG